jgi:DNA processing protein
MIDTTERLAWLKLALTPGVGPGALRELCERFGSPGKVLERSEGDLAEIPKLKVTTRRAILKTAEGKRDEAARRELERLSERGVRLLPYLDPEFPSNLSNISASPALLFVKGTLLPGDENAIGVVGTRRCDSYGLKMTRQIAGELASRGITIVSGLAYGVDAAAHEAALNAGGRTWAFLASGFDRMYPPEHQGLADRIAEQGALLSEFTLDEKPLRNHFPSRNRLISGSTLGVLIVQAPAKSGALITARYAMEQNREVFALPGRVDEPPSEGPNRLIQDGAKLVRNAEDILEELEGRLTVKPHSAKEIPSIVHATDRQKSSAPPQRQLGSPSLSRNQKPSTPQRNRPDLKGLEGDDRRIVLRLEQGPVHIDRLAADLDIPVRKISERMLFLEMKGIIHRLPGMSFDLA